MAITIEVVEDNVITLDVAVGAQGTAGEGVPAGGTAGQVLAKIDGTDYNTQWITSGASLTEDQVIALIMGLS